MRLTRRQFNQLTLSALPAAYAATSLPVAAAPAIDSKIKGVQIGAITYSFRTMADPHDIINAFVTIGLGEMELMSGDCEKLAGAPSAGRGRGAQGADQQAAATSLADWRKAATEATFKPVRKTIEDAGIHLGVLCYGMNANMTDDLIDYAFLMAKGLGVPIISSTTTVSMAKRLAPFAEKHRITVGFHNHDNTEDPNQMATEESFKSVLATSKWLGANFDIGHYVSANGDPVDFLKKYHDRVTNLHIKDRRRNHNGPIAWGQGDVPIKDVLQLIRREKWTFPVNIEYVYDDPDGVIPGVKKCFQFIKDALA